MSTHKRNTKLKHTARDLPRSLTWLSPGIGVKRWIFFLILGTVFVGVGIAIVLLDIYRNAPTTWWLPVVSTLSLQSLDRVARAIIFGLAGSVLMLSGIYGLYRALLAPFRMRNVDVLERLSYHQQRGRGPKIVAIGGGHGLAAVLRSLKEISYNLTAVVTMADDGGSSGRLRQDIGILPPGDIRNCLAALSDDEVLLARLFQYRFPTEFGSEHTGLRGHSFGNLFISALADVMGSFEQAVAESGKVLGVHGRVLPATLHDVRLMADMAVQGSVQDVRVRGESGIPEFPGKVRRVWLEPGSPPAYPQVVQAMLSADIIVVGPGSLYTSILPNLLVPDIAAALKASKALKIYICNLVTQPGETDGFYCEDHITAIHDHLEFNPFDIILANQPESLITSETGTDSSPSQLQIAWVEVRGDSGYPIYQADLADAARPGNHDSTKLVKIILDLYREKTGPLVQ